MGEFLAIVPVAAAVIAFRELGHSRAANELRAEANRFRAEQNTILLKTNGPSRADTKATREY